ncbi:prevent-host-death family protein [Schaalia naturae]|uniref:Prevent-host-death family protein n=1 Tax=Schaalia naturae TaxID=635203 RepID=A0ABW2SJM9_9ACTO
MAASFFSRSSAASARGPQQTAGRSAPETAPVEERIGRWRRELAAVASFDGEDQAPPRLVLTQAHPGGLAQLYAEHTTRLSSLVREPSAHGRALERARAVLQRARELTAVHGVGPIHLAIGRAQWVDGVSAVSSPAMLRPAELQEDPEGDVLITLRPGAQIGEGLAQALARQRVVVDVEAVLAGARTVHGFSPSRALAALRGAGASLDRFELHDELALGVFEHPAAILLREYDRTGPLLASDLVRALGGDADARERTTQALPPPNPADRDPWEEIGVGDLTPRQQDVVEAVSAGRSLVIDAPQGADDLAVLASLVADSGARGRSTLHIAGAPSRAARLETRLRALGVDEMCLRVDGSPESGDLLRERLTEAMSDTSAVMDIAEVEAMRTRLREVRGALSSYTTYLHRPFKHFGVSAFDALQVLTDLTSVHPSPRTRVRLHEDVLVEVARDQGERTRTLLHRASALGVFSRTSAHAAWDGVVINAPEQVTDVLVRIMRLAEESLPRIRVQMSAVAGETGIVPATTVAQWEEQLQMLEGVRDVLDVFHPSIFERSAADMVIATAPRQWRREHGITMSHSQRMRLVRQARDLVRPGRHVEDLHQELLLVQERREVWRHHCDSDGWPTLPEHLDEATALAASVRDDLSHLAPMFSTAYPDLARMDITELGRLLDRLCADTEGARELPQRVAVLKDLAAAGLEGLVTDLRERHVGDDLLDAELDLAWWASILGLMLAQEPRLGGFDPTRLEGVLEEGRLLDEAQVASLAPQALQNLRRMRQQALATRPEQQADLLAAMQTRAPASELYARHPLVPHLVPVVLAVPTLVPWLVPEGRRVDLVILDDVDSLPLAELVPIVARARQVVVLSDLTTVSHGGAVAQLARALPVARLEVQPGRLNAQVAQLLQRYRTEQTGVLVPWTTNSAPVDAIWSTGSGMPAPGAVSVESSAAEVGDVVDAVVDHAVEHPDQSLAVIALNARHADRVRQAVARAVEGAPGLASFFAPDVSEPFQVVDAERARGLSRDRILLTVGFAKTPHGRVLHDFGVLSTPSGVSVLTDALRAVRGDLTVVSSIRGEEIDRSRLSAEGAHMLVDLLEMAGASSRSGEGEAAAAPGAAGQPETSAPSWPTLDVAPDRLLVDLADRLYGMGLEVVPNVGVPGGMRVPLAIGHPEVPGRLLVALLTDDQTYTAEPSLRVRDRVWPAMLEAQGWRVRTELSMAVFTDPEKEAQDIVQLVLDAVDAFNGPAGVVEVPEDAAAEIEPEPEPLEAPVADPALDAAVAQSDQARVLHDERSADPGLAGREDAPASVPAPGGAQEGGASLAGREQTPSARRGPRPAIARGLPLAAYGDDQLDELAQWLRSDGGEHSADRLVEELREALGLTRRGAQTDAVLANVVRRTAPRA